LKKRDAYAWWMADAAAGQAEQAVAGALGRGVLHQERAASRFGLTRCPPSAALAPFVDFYWILRWDLRGQAPHEQTILPHPNVNLAFERTGAAIYGVEERLFSRRLEDCGTVLGVRFRAGGAALAPGLGYADQAHLTRDFTATIGVPPARYVTFAATAPRTPEPKP
jgi:hypothetical protein